MNFNNVDFLTSAASIKGLPARDYPEIAFAGKSNVGKSSVINRILQRKNFARVGEKPGKTIHVNYFLIDKTIVNQLNSCMNWSMCFLDNCNTVICKIIL